MSIKKKTQITEVVLRDAHQSLLATRMKTKDMLTIASKLDSVGYWSIECWGGATFDSCIRFLREDPWERLRQLKKAMPNTRLQMLLRGQNLLGYRHYADDVVDKFVELAALNGVDVFRVFDALNDTRNLKRSIDAVKKFGKHAQGTISYTVSPYHNVKIFVSMSRELARMGCDSICIKDMAGLITPDKAYELVQEIKRATSLPISLHSHATTGMATTSLYAAVQAGCDTIDTAISSLSLGTSHPPTESMVKILSDTTFSSGLDMNLLNEIASYFREIRKQYSEFESSVGEVDTRILLSQIPGGMLSNLEGQLKQQNAFDKLDDVMKEIPNVRKELGYPPLVTPTSQIVGTQAVLNVLQGKRYKTITSETKALLSGYYGKTASSVDEEIMRNALGNAKPITCRPADLIEPELNKLTKEIGKKAKSMEDVLTYALFPKIAEEFFEIRDSGKKIEMPNIPPTAVSKIPHSNKSTQSSAYTVTVDGTQYSVLVEDANHHKGGELRFTPKTHATANGVIHEEDVVIVEAPLAGRVLKFAKAIGDSISKAETVMTIEAMKMETEIKASMDGTITRLFVTQGDEFTQSQPLYAVKKKN